MHHLINEYGIILFRNVIDSFFKNTKEILFEINEKEISEIIIIANNNNFVLSKQIKSHRETSYGNRQFLYFSKK